VRRDQLPVDVRRVRELGTQRPVAGVPDGNCAVSDGCRKETLLKTETIQLLSTPNIEGTVQRDGSG
jgi:hypothetical protein